MNLTAAMAPAPILPLQSSPSVLRTTQKPKKKNKKKKQKKKSKETLKLKTKQSKRKKHPAQCSRSTKKRKHDLSSSLLSQLMGPKRPQSSSSTESKETITEGQVNTVPVVVVAPEAADINPKYLRQAAAIAAHASTMASQLRISSKEDQELHQFLISKRALFRDKQSRGRIVCSEGKVVSAESSLADCRIRMTFYDGGIARFPFSLWPDVFTVIGRDQMHWAARKPGAKIQLFISQIAHGSFRMFLELDFRGLAEPKASEILRICQICQQVIQRYYAAEGEGTSASPLNSEMWVLMTSPKLKYSSKQLRPIIAMGCHVVFPKIMVNAEQATQIAESCMLEIQRYTTAYGDVVDTDPYNIQTNSAHLRPIFCPKLVSCVDCMGLDPERDSCRTCLRRGKQPSYDIYRPSGHFDSQGESMHDNLETFVSSNFVRVIVETAIIGPDEHSITAGYKIPEGEPVSIPAKLRSQRAGDNFAVFREDRRAITRMGTGRIATVVSPTVRNVIVEVLKQYNPMYSKFRCVLGQVLRSKSRPSQSNRPRKKRGSLLVYTVGPCRSKCLVSRTTHSTNRAPVRIYRNGLIMQVCHKKECKELVKTKAGKDLVSKTITLDPMVVSALFPDDDDEDDQSISSTSITKTNSREDCMDLFVRNLGA